MTSPCHRSAPQGSIPLPLSRSRALRGPLAVWPFRDSRWRRRITVFLAFAVLFAGVAQAAHYHKSDLIDGSTHVHCLLCLFAASTAGPPALARVTPPAAPRFCSYRCPATGTGPLTSEAALYDARGPPAA